jgi:hypothetical protein
MIESEQLEPLLSKEEQPLIRLPTPILEQELDEILGQQGKGEEG